MKYFFIAALMFISNFSFASGVIDGEWTTGYVTGQGKTDLAIDGDLVRVTEDRNQCTLNEIGEPAECTRMALYTVEGKFKYQKASIEFLRGTLIYKVEGTNVGIVYFRNMHSTWTRLLKYDDKGQVVFATPLTRK